MSGRFARGSRALGICDRCGQTNKLSALRFQVVAQKPTGLRVCPGCLDVDHPQLMLGRVPVSDPQALKDPRPDTDPGREAPDLEASPGDPLETETGQDIGT